MHSRQNSAEPDPDLQGKKKTPVKDSKHARAHRRRAVQATHGGDQTPAKGVDMLRKVQNAANMLQKDVNEEYHDPYDDWSIRDILLSLLPFVVTYAFRDVSLRGALAFALVWSWTSDYASLGYFAAFTITCLLSLIPVLTGYFSDYSALSIIFNYLIPGLFLIAAVIGHQLLGMWYRRTASDKAASEARAQSMQGAAGYPAAQEGVTQEEATTTAGTVGTPAEGQATYASTV
ncbi:hypothetical protein DUNSADRAFT_4740 [Dunaliella salina]|uniref:Uncharacterized protein n=1 Tax=Dunaliella salina TaxID=3046 RepID=A0ABQ7GRE9_DUNSA|nr:hypothetical protein DUNSADRAFT_4740 [Dunaliella salina]|eukprot:KAF5837180.1 hypothetical protein DUNSADRAFT_4740 [Dunaliella salina]